MPHVQTCLNFVFTTTHKICIFYYSACKMFQNKCINKSYLNYKLLFIFIYITKIENLVICHEYRKSLLLPSRIFSIRYNKLISQWLLRTNLVWKILNAITYIWCSIRPAVFRWNKKLAYYLLKFILINTTVAKSTIIES